MRLFLSVLLLSLLSFPAWALTNQLKDNPSPYLALHGHDPVAWQEWNAQAIEQARKENKLLFVSIGYFSCHWCHVMQRESYRNPEIAGVLNKYFIPVKVDRELSGALDAEMQEFAMKTRNQSGWPLNMFITPEGYPLFATLYSPPPEFLQIITRMQEKWAKESATLKQVANRADSTPSPHVVAEAKFAPVLGEKYRSQLVQEALAQADVFRGGFGADRKFPMSPQLSALLDAYRQNPQPKLAEFLKLTLDQMASQGLADHVGGGFFRYATDPDWRVPHFEKMLYDNAQLAQLYLRAAEIFHEPRYRQIAFATLDFMLAEMRDPQSRALIASTSAIDAQGREGGVYLWSRETLTQALTPDEFTLANKIWGMTVPAEFDLGYLPVHKTAPSATELEKLTVIYRKLAQLRSQRVLPKDTKLLASLNGLALQSLSEAARSEPRYRPAAKEVRDFIVNKLWRQELQKGESQGASLGPADLQDYAYSAAGLLSYAKLTGKAEDFDSARRLALEAWSKFHSDAGWKLEQKPLLARIYYQAIVPDSMMPSPSSVLINVSWQLGGKELRTHALKALNTGYDALDQGVFWYASQVGAMNALQEGK